MAENEFTHSCVLRPLHVSASEVLGDAICGRRVFLGVPSDISGVLRCCEGKGDLVLTSDFVAEIWTRIL